MTTQDLVALWEGRCRCEFETRDALVGFALVVAFAVVVLDVLGQGRRNEFSPKRIARDKHSSFTDRTQRSANAFRFGLRAGNFSGRTLPALITSRNTGQNLPSRSCSG
jgi:hypothetical protein